MANFKVDSYGLAGKNQSLPLGEETYGTVGPIEKKWVKKHVYWVLPLGTALIIVLVLFAVDAFDRPEKVVMVSVPTPTASSQIRGSSTTEGPTEMTVSTVKSALAETETILSAADRIARQMRPLSEKVAVRGDPAPPTPALPTTKAGGQPPAASPPPSIWDINK